MASVRPRLAVRLDPVVDDLEAGAVEALHFLEVASEPARDRDMCVSQARDRAVAERKPTVLAELVEAVLRRHANRHARQRAGELPVDIRVHEMRVQDPWAEASEVAGDADEGHRIHVGGERDRVERDPARLQLTREVPGPGLVLVQHQEAHVPTALLQLRQQRQQMRLRAGDAGDLLQVEDVHVAAARMPSAQVSTECLRATRSRKVRPISARSAALSAANQRSRSARLSGDSRSKKSG